MTQPIDITDEVVQRPLAAVPDPQDPPPCDHRFLWLDGFPIACSRPGCVLPRDEYPFPWRDR